MLESQKITEAVKKAEPKLIEERRRFHINAELPCEEFETVKYILEQMAELGLEPVWVREPVSPYFVLDTGKPGKTIVFRADTDALPMQEDECNLKQKKVAVSKNPGVCHACGHDGHTAMLLTVARILAEYKDDLCGKFIFFFESGEEKGYKFCTAIPFAKILEEIKPDAVWGIHLCSFMECGQISVQAGARMASSGRFEILIKGKGGHGSTPHLAINPLYAATNIVDKLQNIIPQFVTDEVATLAVTNIQGGNGWNIIPDTCVIKGTYRCCSEGVYNLISEHILSIVDDACSLMGCTVEYMHKPGEDEFKPVINDAKLSAVAEKALDKILPGARVEEPVWMASESFGKYQKVAPGIFAFVGVKNDELGSGAEHHNSKFDIDEGALSLGVCATLQFVADFI